MGTHDPWIESTAEALRARMQRVRPSSGVRRSELLANHHLETCESITLDSSHGRYSEQASENTPMNP